MPKNDILTNRLHNFGSIVEAKDKKGDLHRPLLYPSCAKNNKTKSHVPSIFLPSSSPSDTSLSSCPKLETTKTIHNNSKTSPPSSKTYSYSTFLRQNHSNNSNINPTIFYSCCSMPFKMPTAAREAFAFVANLFGASTSTAQISTELTAHNGKQVGENGKTTAVVITEQPRSGHNSTQVKPVQQVMPPTGKPSLTDSREQSSDEFSDDSILAWEPDVDEKELVKKTWSDDFDFLYELGSAIYTYIFETNPNTKQLFPSIHQYGDRWKESKEFRQQALRFVQTLSHTVKNLYHMERLAPYLYKIGELHVKFAKRGFQPEFWNDFLDAMEVSLADSIKRNKDLTDEQKKEATRVWRRLALYVITNMKRGYNDLLKKTEAG